MSTIDFTKNDTYRRSYDNILQIKKHANSKEELPTLGASNGDIYSVGEDNELYIFNSGWKPVGGSEGLYELNMSYNDDGGYWIGDFGDLADLDEAINLKKVRDVVVVSDIGDNIVISKLVHLRRKITPNGMLVTDIRFVGGQITYPSFFTQDSMRFMGRLNEYYNGFEPGKWPKNFPVACMAEESIAPLVFHCDMEFPSEAGTYVLNAYAELSCLSDDLLNPSVVNNVLAHSISTTQEGYGELYQFAVSVNIDENTVKQCIGTIEAVEIGPERVYEGADGISVVPFDLIQSLIGSKVYVESGGRE